MHRSEPKNPSSVYAFGCMFSRARHTRAGFGLGWLPTTPVR